MTARTATAEAAELPDRVELYGTVAADRTAAVSSRVMANVIAVPVKAGDLVKAGDVLVEIDPATAKGQEAQAKGALAQARAAEASGALAMSVFGGFPLVDIARPGLSVVGMANARDAANVDLTQNAVESILEAAWARRAEFVYHSEKLKDSIARAKQMSEGPVLLIDHADNCASGGTQDTVAVLREALKQGLKDMAVFAICDPQAVGEMIKAGVGARLTLNLGGKTDMPSIGLKGRPLTVASRVRTIADGETVFGGPMYTGVKSSLGRAAVLDTGRAQIVVTERHHEPFDLLILRHFGIEPTSQRFIMLKSRIHYRAGFKPIASHIVECAGAGVTNADLTAYPYRKLRRPIYPLDPM